MSAGPAQEEAVVPDRRGPLLPVRRGKGIGPIAVDFGTSSSTVTMYDSLESQERVLWPAQAALIADGLAELLGRDGWPDADAQQRVVEQYRKNLGDKTAALIGDDAGALAARLTDDAKALRLVSANRYLSEVITDSRDREKRLLEVVHRFEDLLADLNLREWLAGPLHRVYRTALAAAAPEAYLLAPVHLDLEPPTDGGVSGLAGRDIPSRLVVGPQSPVATARLQHPTGGAALEWVGVKRFLADPKEIADLRGKPLPPGWSPDSELLLALCYRDLMARTYEYLDHLAKPGPNQKTEFAGRAIDQVTVTYPTITPPKARQALRTLVADALGLWKGELSDANDVDVSYDEAVAASLYFVQRELGGDGRGGVDALRARSRRMPDGSHRRTMLVIDIGGGTTDVALLALDLVEKPVQAAVGPFEGRDYELAPKVLGTTGHQQLGGDLLTLRVFYWIKALIVDALVADKTPGLPALAEHWPAEIAGRPAPDALAPLVLGYDTHEGPAPITVREVLRALLPTHSDRDGANAQTPAFRKIWAEAERVKLRLARPEGQLTHAEVTLSEEWLTELKHDLTCGWGGAVAGLGNRITLTSEEFAQLAEPVIGHAMTLAAALARRRLSNSDDAIVDVVALAGRTCEMELTKQVAAKVIGDTLVDDASGKPLVCWNPSSIQVEHDNAKQAASIGAAWAHSRVQHDAKATSKEALQTGDDRIAFDVENLLLQMPSSFAVRGMNVLIPVFEVGEEFDRFRPEDDTRFRSSRWLPVAPTIELVRRIEGGRDIRWGRFRYSRYSDNPPPDVQYCIEMDQHLRPRLILRRGTEDHRVIVPACRHFDLARFLRPAAGADGLAYLPRIEAYPVDGDGRSVVLFDGGDFDTWLDIDAEPSAWARGGGAKHKPVRGAVSTRPLPAPVGTGAAPGTASFGLVMITRDGERVDVGIIKVPHDDPRVTRWPVALDQLGRLWVMRFDSPLRRTAGDIREMEHRYGLAFEVDMDDFVPDSDPSCDPYSGIH